MLRFWDDRTGSYAGIAATSSIPLRVCIHGPSDGAWSAPADLRVLLVADVLTRIAELHGQPVIAVLATATPPPGAFGRDASALGIHPPAARTSPGEAEASLGGPAHVHVARDTVARDTVAGNTGAPGDRADAVFIGVGPVEDLADQQAGRDLLALRLALLSRSYRQPVKLTGAVLADAAESLSRWRARVAEWAREPSSPIPREIAERIRGAFDEDLNTVAALDLLREVESGREIPAGAKFETFVFVDRVLGLELAREIGRW